MFNAISFAGGGNRCYWQGGFFEALAQRIELKPALAVGVSADTLARLKAATDFRLMLTRLPAALPPLIGAALGVAAYQVEKHLLRPVHPRFGRGLGFRAECVAVRDLATRAT